MVRVLFVCLGNICRSPQAEGVFARQVHDAGLAAHVVCDSAGTSDYHVGELPHPRTRAASARHGIELTHRARQVIVADLDRFDWVVAMDHRNLADLQQLAGRSQARLRKLRLLREFDPDPGDLAVPDPYGGGDDGFERVFQICQRSTQGLLVQVRASLRQPVG
jgi:protein-tyrosine phosphatase